MPDYDPQRSRGPRETIGEEPAPVDGLLGRIDEQSVSQSSESNTDSPAHGISAAKVAAKPVASKKAVVKKAAVKKAAPKKAAVKKAAPQKGAKTAPVQNKPSGKVEMATEHLDSSSHGVDGSTALPSVPRSELTSQVTTPPSAGSRAGRGKAKTVLVAAGVAAVIAAVLLGLRKVRGRRGN